MRKMSQGNRAGKRGGEIGMDIWRKGESKGHRTSDGLVPRM